MASPACRVPASNSSSSEAVDVDLGKIKLVDGGGETNSGWLFGLDLYMYITGTKVGKGRILDVSVTLGKRHTREPLFPKLGRGRFDLLSHLSAVGCV